MIDIERYPEETEIITFRTGRDGYPVGRAPDGMIVIADPRSHLLPIDGRSYHCRLYRNGQKLMYFALVVEALPVDDETEVEDHFCEGAFAVGNDTIRSLMLNEGRYFAFRSPNGAYLELKSGENGQFEVKNNGLVIPGLDDLFDRPLPCAVGCRATDDGLLIKIGE